MLLGKFTQRVLDPFYNWQMQSIGRQPTGTDLILIVYQDSSQHHLSQQQVQVKTESKRESSRTDALH